MIAREKNDESGQKLDFLPCPLPPPPEKVLRSPRSSGSGIMSGNTPRPTPPSAEESRAPTPSAEDQLVAQETALFGPVSEYEETGLPPPPYDPKAANGGGGVDAAGKKINGGPPRAKRPKNLKIRRVSLSIRYVTLADPCSCVFSPNKGNKTLARRSIATSNGQKGPGDEVDVGLVRV